MGRTRTHGSDRVERALRRAHRRSSAERRHARQQPMPHSEARS